jgi:hypothetical protein
VPIALEFGGSARANAAASADLWPRIVTFLHRHLAGPGEWLPPEDSGVITVTGCLQLGGAMVTSTSWRIRAWGRWTT